MYACTHVGLYTFIEGRKVCAYAINIKITCTLHDLYVNPCIYLSFELQFSSKYILLQLFQFLIEGMQHLEPRQHAYTRCITVSDSICAAQTLSVQPRLYLCLSLTLSVKICANNTDMSCNSEKKYGKSA